MVIITSRRLDTEMADHPLKRVKQELLPYHLCEEIALEPLSKAEIAEYLGRESGKSVPEGFAELIYRRSEGNPLFMMAALDHMTEHGSIAREGGRLVLKVPLQEIDLGVPETLRQMIETQIDHLTAEEQRVLEAASVAGVRFSPDVVAAAIQRDGASVEETLDELSRRSRIVRAAAAQQLEADGISQTFEFVHALYSEVFCNRLTPARRASIRRRIEESASQPLREVVEITAAHLPRESGCTDLTMETGRPGHTRAAAMTFA
jgi:predicted ATPase